MEAVFAENLTSQHSIIQLSPSEVNHCRVRRMQDRDPVIVLNGKGLACLGMIVLDEEYHTISVQCKQFKEMYGESMLHSTVLLGWLDHKERLEFALEKCTELGVKRFILSQTRFSSKKKPDIERLRDKVLSAIKQCKRSILPEILITHSLAEALHHLNDTRLIVADPQGSTDVSFPHPLCVCIGPEGGFSEEEREEMRSHMSGCSFLSLGKRRLRAETAAIATSALLLHNS